MNLGAAVDDIQEKPAAEPAAWLIDDQRFGIRFTTFSHSIAESLEKAFAEDGKGAVTPLFPPVHSKEQAPRPDVANDPEWRGCRDDVLRAISKALGSKVAHIDVMDATDAVMDVLLEAFVLRRGDEATRVEEIASDRDDWVARSSGAVIQASTLRAELEAVDEALADMEDRIKGRDGDLITELRGRIEKALAGAATWAQGDGQGRTAAPMEEA